ncbi:hypothetical protein [Burkholderia sp. PU8-34]
MVKLLRKTAFVAAVFALVWGAVFAWWKASYHPPTGTELMLFGIALPAALAAAIAWGRRALDRARASRVPVRPQAAGTSPSSGPAAPAPAQGDASRPWTIALLDSSVRLPTGTTTAEVEAAARDERVVGLHPDLQRTDGTSVFAARVDTVSLDRFDKDLLPPGIRDTLKDEHWRGLMLTADALDELLERHAALADTSPGAERLKLHLLLPERWQPVAATLAAWLDAHIARERLAPGIERVQTRTVANPVQAWAVVDELIQSVHLQPSADSHVVLACDSLSSQESIDALDRGGRLYGQNCPNGRTPGEGACALLLGHPDTARAMPAPQIHRLAAAHRATSADHPGNAKPGTLEHLLDAARARLSTACIGVPAGGLVSDADQRSSRRTEIVGATARAWPDDAAARCRHLGLANGESGAALALSVLAIAGDRASDEQQAILAVSTSDPVARGVMPVAPAATAPATSQPLAAAA